MGGAGRRKTEGGGELPSWWMWEVLTRRTQRKRRKGIWFFYDLYKYS